MGSRSRPGGRSKGPLLVLVLGFLISGSASAADSGRFSVIFSKVDKVQRLSQNDRVELQLTATTTLATTSSIDWPVPNEIPAELKVVRLRYLLSTVTEEHSDSILDACQQMALLAQNQPDRYELAVSIKVPDASQVTVYSPAKLIAYLHSAGYQFTCTLSSLQ